MKRLYYIFIILFSFLLISCNKDENDVIVDTYKFLLVSSETDFPSVWSVNDTIGITAYISGSEEVYSDCINKRHTTNGNGTFVPATPEDKILYPLAGQFVDFYAYYPCKAEVFTSYLISLNEQSNQKQIDLLYSNNAKNKTNISENIEFVFNHVLSKIVINTTPSESLVKEDLHGMNITINNVCNEGIFYLANGCIEASAPKSSIKMKTKADGSTSEAIVLPGSASGAGFTIELANGNIYNADFPQGQQFVSGHIHTYNVTITQTGIVLSPIEIEDWVMNGDYPQEETANEIEYKTGDFFPNPGNPNTAIGVVYWLKPGTSGKEGRIVSFDSATKTWGDSSYGNLNTSISAGIMNWDIVIGRDPSLESFPAFKWCMDKGEGWYLPSRYELHVLQELWLKHGEYMNSNILLKGGEPFTSNDVYLVSSESRSWPNDRAETYYFSTKGWLPIYKNELGRIRAVKEF